MLKKQPLFALLLFLIVISFIEADVVPAETDLREARDTSVVSADNDASYATRPRRRRKHKRRRQKPKPKPKEREVYEDDYYYDRDDSYGSPKAPASGYKAETSAYEAPASPSYSAPQTGYDAPSYEAPSYHSSGGYSSGGGGGGSDGLTDFLNALAAFLPIGLFLAAIPPNLITINSRRKRELFEDLDEDIKSLTTYQDHDFQAKLCLIYQGCTQWENQSPASRLRDNKWLIKGCDKILNSIEDPCAT